MEQEIYTENDIQRYLFLLDKNFGNDDVIRSQAEAEINEEGSQNILKSTLIFSEIVLRDGIDYPLVWLSLVWLKKIFTPIYPITENQIALKWLSIDDQLRNRVKMAIFRGLMFPDVRIISQASLTFATLLNIEKLQMFDLIAQLYNLIEQPDYSELTKAGAINVLAEISGPKSLGGHTDIIEVQNLLIDIFMHIGNYFYESQNKSLDIRYNIALAIDTFLDVASPLFNERDTVYSLIDLTIKNLESIQFAKPVDSTASPDQFHALLLSILFKIIKIHYNNFDFNPGIIFDYTIDKIYKLNNNPNEHAYISNLLQFWTWIANYEHDIIKYNHSVEKIIEYKIEHISSVKLNKFPNKKEYREFCNFAMPKLADKLKDIMIMISPNDKESEDVSFKEPHMYATCLFQIFFKIEPKGVFLHLKNLWYDAVMEYYQEMRKQQKDDPNAPMIPPGPINWIKDHALLLTISIFCRKINERYKDDLVEDLNNFFFNPIEGTDNKYVILRDYVIGTCLTFNTIPKITDTCLYSLSRIFHRYPQFLKKEVFNYIFAWFANNYMTSDTVIFLRILHLIIAITLPQTISIIDADAKDEILNKFDFFIELFNVGIHRQDAMVTDIYRFSYSMISSVAYASLLNDRNPSNIAKLIDNQLHMMNELSSSFIDGYNFTKICQIIFFFNTIFKHPERAKDFKDYVPSIINAYKKIMNPNSPIYEDSLTGLGIIIRCLDDNTDGILNKVNEKVNEALSSGSPSIITSASYIRATLYDKFITYRLPGYQELLNQFQSNYDWVIRCLLDTNFTRDFYPLLLKSLSLLIQSCSYYIKQNPEGIIFSFFEQFEHFSSFPIEVKNENDIEYANLFYESTFIFGKSIMSCIPQQDSFLDDRRLQKTFMDKIPKNYLQNLEFKFTDSSLKAFIEYLTQYNDTFGTHGNIIFHRKDNFLVVLHAMCSESLYIKEEAIKLAQIMKNA